MKKVIILLAVIAVSGCHSSKKTVNNGNARFMVENLEDMSARELKNKYANANIKEGSGMFAEGSDERPYTILYPNTPDELHITWEDKERTKIHDLRFADKGKWKSKTGVMVGMSHDELTRLNKKPISIYGFGWDYSGAVQWNNGELENSGLRVFLAPGNHPKNKFIGDQIIKPTSKELKQLDLRVSAILINYAE